MSNLNLLMNNILEDTYFYRAKWLHNQIQELTKDREYLTVPELSSIDQYHYLYTDAIDEAALKLDLSNRSEVLDIGSGVGGTGRYLAWKYGCSVTGIELLSSLHNLAVELTKLTGLGDKVRCLQGDFLSLESLSLSEQRFDCWVSFNVFLHISDRATLFSNCAKVLKPGGSFYIEDYFQRQPLNLNEKANLAEGGVCADLPNRERYLKDLESSGFVDLEFQDVTNLWIPWVAERSAKFDSYRQEKLCQQDVEVFNSYSKCCQEVSQLFSGGNLGGARIFGRLPKEACES